jgi:aspartate racemase
VRLNAKYFLGVLGGMGPLASAEFLKTIYEFDMGEREQESLPVIMYSDPTFPDRTEALLSGSYGPLVDQLEESLHRLLEFGVSRIVICCITIHHLLPLLPAYFTTRIVSLLDVIFEEVRRRRERQLLICTTGTRRLGLFEGHSEWDELKNLFVLPDDQDQHSIHELIYDIKRNCNINEIIPRIESLLLKYEADSFIAGCTELHLVSKSFPYLGKNRNGSGCVDPLILIAGDVWRQNLRGRTHDIQECSGVV